MYTKKRKKRKLEVFFHSNNYSRQGCLGLGAIVCRRTSRATISYDRVHFPPSRKVYLRASAGEILRLPHFPFPTKLAQGCRISTHRCCFVYSSRLMPQQVQRIPRELDCYAEYPYSEWLSCRGVKNARVIHYLQYFVLVSVATLPSSPSHSRPFPRLSLGLHLPCRGSLL